MHLLTAFELYDQVPALPALVPSDLFVLILMGAGLA